MAENFTEEISQEAIDIVGDTDEQNQKTSEAREDVANMEEEVKHEELE